MLFSRKDLRKLIIPLVIEQILAVTIGMADTVMVSSVGEAAVSGISLVDTINVLLINIFSALATGGAVVAAQYMGRKDHDNANTAASALDLRLHRAGCHEQCTDLFSPVCAVLSIFSSVQFRRRLIPVHGEFQSLHVHVPYHESRQCLWQRRPDIHLQHGRRGCGHRIAGIPRSGRDRDASVASQSKQPDLCAAAT